MPAAVNNLTVNNAAGLTLGQNTTVNGNLFFTAGRLSTGANTVTLGAVATVVNETSEKYLVGRLQATRQVGTVATGFGGMGVSIDPLGNDLDSVTVLRISGLAGRRTFGTKESIDRTWLITPQRQPISNCSVTFSWVSADDNGQDLTDAQLWHREDLGPWVEIGAPENVSIGRSITRSTDQLAEFTVFTASGPLPVTLLSFGGRRQGNAVVLNWETASELNNAGFEVERSADLKQFVRIGLVEATPRPQAVNRYRFTDENYTQDSYYRLKQLDRNGQYQLSKPIFVKGGESIAQEGLLLYPNPTNGEVHLVLPDVGEARLTLSVNGITLADFTVTSTQEAERRVSRQLRRLPAGMYLLQTRQGGQSYQNKLVKQ
ncbi:MAG: T9SS type A sorting domain-containing protein [Ferruginibacter sp.]|nr:T9SS type A sorting domain-containing protein [Cytophagales bacterium]